MSTPQDEMRAEFEVDPAHLKIIAASSSDTAKSNALIHAARALDAQAEALAAAQADLTLAQERATWLVAQIRDTQEACGVLQTALASAQEDTARLTWIAHQDLEDLAMGLVVDADHDGEYFVSPDSGGTFYGKTLREAIDTARATLTPTAQGAQEQA